MINKTPSRVLDAPGLKNDFYLNVVDWSCKNHLAVALDNLVYTWDASNAKVNKLVDAGESDSISSVNFNKAGSQLAVGLDSGKVQVWDLEAQKVKETFNGH